MPKPTSSRQRTEESEEPKRIFLVATEDSVTGAFQYFEELSETHRYRFLNKYSFKMAVIPSINGKSSPQDVLENLKKEIKSRGIEIEKDNDETDSFWIVCDTDSWKEEHISAVVDECHRLNLLYAFSKPCFEIWVLFHQEEFDNSTIFKTSQDCKSSAALLLQKRGKYEHLITQQQIDYAIDHAEKADKTATSKWPGTQGSHVYKLMQDLLKRA